jgi:hypothetical protein
MQFLVSDSLSAAERRAVDRTFDRLRRLDNYPYAPKHFEHIRKLAGSPALVQSLMVSVAALDESLCVDPCFCAIGVLLAAGGDAAMTLVAERVQRDIAHCTPIETLFAQLDPQPCDLEGARGPWLHAMSTYRRLIRELRPDAEALVQQVCGAWRTLAEPTRAYQLLALAGVEPPSDTDWSVAILPRDERADACIEATYVGWFLVQAAGRSPESATAEDEPFRATTLDNLSELRADLDAWSTRRGVRWAWSQPWKAGVEHGALVKTSGLCASDRKIFSAWWRRP